MNPAITYSSLISLSLAKYEQIYIYTDGFMSNDLQLTSFNTVHGNLFHDFQNSVFRIVPEQIYDWTQRLLKDISKDELKEHNDIPPDDPKKPQENEVQQRKHKILRMKTNIDGEVTSNIANTNKLTGTPLTFGSSKFMLVHVTSLKFLTLNDDNPEDLRFQLTDFPNEGSVLRFAPCLNFQKLRTNNVHDKDAVILQSVKSVCNRQPSLHNSYKGNSYNYKETKQKHLKKQFESEVKSSKTTASIEYHSRWRVEAYYIAQENERSQKNDHLHVGDVIALHLSEMKLYLNALKPYDPFKRILKYLNVENLETKVHQVNENKQHLLKKTKLGISIERDGLPQQKQEDVAILKKILIDDQLVAFQDFNYFKVNEQKLTDLPNSCFWKIESQDQMSGGLVQWSGTYRLRHFQTGRYLQIGKINDVVQMDLVSNATDDSLFRFVQIQNSEDQESAALKSDSFFYLWHCNSQVYLGISDDDQGNNKKVEEVKNELEVFIKEGYLSVVQNHYTTYRMKKIDFAFTWETSMLQFSLPFFLEAIGFIQKLSSQEPISCLVAYNDEDVRNKIYFFQIYTRVFKALDVYSEFVNNKLISNIAVNQEYAMIVKSRQNIVREQNIFILLIWMVFRCFPRRNVIEMITQTQKDLLTDFADEPDFMFRVQSFLQNRTLESHPRMLRRLDENHNKRLVVLSYKVYQTIEDFCRESKQNQRTLVKLINIVQQHIGLGDQVVSTFINTISNTPSILNTLPKTMVTLTNQIAERQQSNGTESAIMQAVENDKKYSKSTEQANAVLAIITKLLEFPPFAKPEIIQLLSSICSCGDLPIYVNQNLIYRSFIENKQVSNHAFMKLNYKFGELLIQCIDEKDQFQTIKFLEFFDEQYRDRPNYLKQYTYVKNQFELIANLCLSRNIIACTYFKQIFLLNKLISYFKLDKLDQSMKAVVLKLIRTLYIDQVPYQPQKRPELVREIEYDEKLLTTKIYKRDNGILSIFKVNDGKYVTIEQARKLQRKNLISQETILYQTNRKRKILEKESLIIPKDESDSEIEESEEITKFIVPLIQSLIQYVKNMSESLQETGQNMIYNELALEVIKILSLLVQFGFFNKMTYKHLKDDKPSTSDIELLINSLSTILEFDYNYFEALKNASIIRRHQEQKEEREAKEKAKNVFNPDLNVNLDVLNILDDAKGPAKKRKVIHQDREMEVILDPLFRKIKGLKKILDKCSNKTFQYVPDAGNNSFEVQIKIEICKLFMYFLNMRQDFLIDNAIEYFKHQYIPSEVSKLKDYLTYTDILSEQPLEIGQEITEHQPVKEFTAYNQIVHQFDSILERPFYEVLLLSLYFSSNASLSNMIVSLIHKFSSQKSELLQNLSTLQVVISTDQVMFYKRWSRMLNRLKRNIPNCQAWLQLDTAQKLNGRNELQFEKNIRLLQKIRDIFEEDQLDNQKMKIKQRIFKHAGGFDSLMTLIDSCVIIIRNNTYVFKFKQATTNFEQYQQQLGKNILKLMDLVLQIMTLFSSNSMENQELVYQKLIRVLCHNRSNNYGQVRFINGLFNDNPKLTQQVTRDREIETYFKLIKKYGRYLEFLDFLLILLKNAELNNTGQSNILSMHIVTLILNRDYYKYVSPFEPQPNIKRAHFYAHDPQPFYKGKFLIILSNCLKNFIGVSLINRAQQTFTMELLLNALVEISREEGSNLSEQFDLLLVRSSIFEIILILTDKIEKQQLIQCAPIIQEFLQVEINYLNSRALFTPAQQTYLFKKQSIFLLKYFKLFFKDASAQIFSNTESKKIERRKIQEYGKAFLNALLHMNNVDLQEDQEKIRIIQEIGQVLKLELPRSLRQKKQDDEEEQVAEEVKDLVYMQFDQSLVDNKQQEYSQATLVSQKGARGFLSKFKSLKKLQEKQQDSSESAQISQYWQIFISAFSEDKDVIGQIKSEKSAFANSVWNVLKMFQTELKPEQRDLVLNYEDIVQNLLQYLQYAQQNGADHHSVLFVIRILKNILKVTESGDGEEEEKQEELKERQDILNKLNATRITMQLLWSDSENNLEYLSTLLSFFCMLLKNGNIVVQTTVYEYSITSPECEKLYYKLHTIMQNYINASPAELKQQGKLQVKLITHVLRFMQLLCEGHNNRMQNYLLHQTNSKNSYNLVTLVVKLLQCIKVDNKNYDITEQCFDTLTELIQGPCKANQVALSNSKFMDYVVALLSESDEIFDTVQIQNEHKDPKILSVIHQQAMRQNLKLTEKISAPKDILNRKKLLDENQPYNFTLHLAKLARLKLKALTTLYALVECADLTDSLILRIIRAIPSKVLTANLYRVFELFEKYEHRKYEMSLFQRNIAHIDFELKKDNVKVDDEYYELIIEIGFQIYFLIQTFIQSKKGKEILQEDTQLRELLPEFEMDAKVEDEEGLLPGGIPTFGLNLDVMGKMGNQLMSLAQEKTDDQKRKEKEEAELKAEEEKKNRLKKAIQFFKKNSCSIEIVRDEEVFQVYFIKLPFCHRLPKDLKTEFHTDVPRTSGKAKLNYLMSQSAQIIKTMKHEEDLKKLFDLNPMFGLIANQGKLWELCLFITTIAINIIICFSYSQSYWDPNSSQSLLNARLEDPRLFDIKSLTMAKQVILIFGILDLVFSGLIVFFFLLKRAPLKVYDIWIGFFDTQGFVRIIVTFIKGTLRSTFRLLQDFDILYYSAYILAGVIGLAVHPFVFCVHLMDFLKLEQLKTVVMAVYQPRLELILAMVLLVVLEYYFTIVAWVGLSSQYPASSNSGEQLCNSFWMCLVTTFDWTFKFTGSIGSHLQDPQTLNLITKKYQDEGDEIPGYQGVDPSITNYFYGRFFFDNVFNIILVFILLNMIQGIIIDTFGSLREKQATKNNDMQQKCFICGFDMEQLDKSSDSDKGFEYHIDYEHHMWNYIFYRAYLEFKDPNEYDGNESYVKHRIDNSDLSWIPIKKAKSVMSEEKEDAAKIQSIDNLEQQVAYKIMQAQSLEETLSKVVSRIEKARKETQ